MSNKPKEASGLVMSVYVDKPLERKIRVLAAKEDREISYVIRMLIRKGLGLKPTGRL